MPRPSTAPLAGDGSISSTSAFGRMLEHPLPAGMRDLLPPIARRQGELARRVTGCFELHGYELVTLPVFEYADVLERGLGALDPDDVLRFVEPETGAVVALRPDMTPQIARIVATRLSELPAPARLCYHGSVMRRRRERARQHRQIFQAGVELLGLEGPEGDLEVLALAAAGVRAAGLQRFVIDLSHARIAQSLLEGLAAEHSAELVEALALKDQAQVAHLAGRLSSKVERALVGLCELYGGASIWPKAEALLAGTSADGALRELRRIWDSAHERDLAPELLVDFGETRHFAYYTGMMFQIHAEGPGSPIGAGGRYDGLLNGFGAPRAAAGFALGLDHLGWALERIATTEEPSSARILIAGEADALLAGLRGLGVACAPAPLGDALSYARAWRYTHVLTISSATLCRVRDERKTPVALEPEALVRVLE